jgi:hypothetical protein
LQDFRVRPGHREVRLLAAAGAIVVSALAGGACSLKDEPSRNATRSALSRLAAADALVRAGCFDCLASAHAEYSSLRSITSVSAAATLGAIRTAALLAVRQRELGALDSGYLARAGPPSV